MLSMRCGSLSEMGIGDFPCRYMWLLRRLGSVGGGGWIRVVIGYSARESYMVFVWRLAMG